MTTDNTQELDEILEKVRYAAYYADYHANHTQEHINSIIAEHVAEQKQAILDWHNKQIEEIIKKPHILPKNAYHLESVKQGINFYHRQMRKRIDKLKEKY